MPFPTVKTDPWKKGARKPRRRFTLWSESFWRLLVKTEHEERGDAIFGCTASNVCMTEKCVELVSEQNFLLYGKR